MLIKKMYKASHDVNKLQKLFVTYICLSYWFKTQHVLFELSAAKWPHMVSEIPLIIPSGTTRPTVET